MTYEYAHVTVGSPDEAHTTANLMGAGGWRLVNLMEREAGVFGYECFFERADADPRAAQLATQGTEIAALRLMIADAFGIELLWPNDLTGVDPAP